MRRATTCPRAQYCLEQADRGRTHSVFLPVCMIAMVLRCILCALAFLIPMASGGIELYLPTREAFFKQHKVVPGILSYLPAGTVELWTGWQRIYPGGAVTKGSAPSVRFSAVPQSFATLVEVDDRKSACVTFNWVKVNIPGGDVNAGEDVVPRGTPPDDTYVTLLVFPQSAQLQLETAKAFFKDNNCQAMENFTSAYRLEKAEAIGVYIIPYEKNACRDQQYNVPDDEKSNWTALKQNLKKIKGVKPDYLWTTPDGVLEVEYGEGVSLRFGNCVPVFLTAFPPTKTAFAGVAAGHLYTVMLIDTIAKHPMSWFRVNIPAANFAGGKDVVSYVGPLEAGGVCLFLLFSQGNKELNVTEAANLTSAKDVSSRLHLGDPVASNFFVPLALDGLPPRSGSPPTRPPGTLTTTPSAVATMAVDQTTKPNGAVRSATSSLLVQLLVLIVACGREN